MLGKRKAQRDGKPVVGHLQLEQRFTGSLSHPPAGVAEQPQQRFNRTWVIET